MSLVREPGQCCLEIILGGYHRACSRMLVAKRHNHAPDNYTVPKKRAFPRGGDAGASHHTCVCRDSEVVSPRLVWLTGWKGKPGRGCALVAVWKGEAG